MNRANFYNLEKLPNGRDSGIGENCLGRTVEVSTPLLEPRIDDFIGR